MNREDEVLQNQAVSVNCTARGGKLAAVPGDFQAFSQFFVLVCFLGDAIYQLFAATGSHMAGVHEIRPAESLIGIQI